MTTVTSAPFASLGLPEPADKMDISSPYNRNLDDFDIDIDIPPRPSDQDEDFILEDLRSDTGINQQDGQIGDTDDFMVDEERQSILSEDRTMGDDDTIQDEHLTDASEIGLEETVSNQTGHNSDHQTNVSVTAEGNENETVRDNEDGVKHASPEMKSTEAQEVDKYLNVPVDDKPHEDDLGADNSDEQYAAPPFASHLANSEAELSGEGQPVNDVKESADNAETNNKDESNSLLGTTLEDSNNISHSINTGNTSEGPELPITLTSDDNERISTTLKTRVRSASLQDNESESPITPLHPITVHYDGNELSLFPPSNDGSSETFLLDDENLVNVSITDLLRACRVVLGETFDEVDELVLSIEALGISLSEECLHAASTSFNDILHVYTRLKQLDGAESEPLYVILSPKPRFSVRFQALQTAVSDGRGLSQVPFLAEDVNTGVDEDDDKDSVHDESYDANGQLQDDHEEQQPQEALSNISSSEVNVDERITLDTNQIPNVENEETVVSQTAQTDENDISEVETERGINDEPLEHDTTTHKDLQALEYVEEDDLVIYGDGDNGSDGEEGSIDLPEQGAVTSERPAENYEIAENVQSDEMTSHKEPSATGTNSLHGDIPYPLTYSTADFAVNDVMDNGKEEKVKNIGVPKSEPEWNDEDHDEGIYDIVDSDQVEDAVYQDGSSYDEIGNPEDFPEVIAPADADEEVKSAPSHFDTVIEENSSQHHPVNQDDGQGLGMDTKITARANAQTEVQLNEDALLLETDASLHKESLEYPEYGESSALLENDRRSSSAEHDDIADEEETRGEPVNTSTDEIPVNQENGESVNSIHHVEESNAASRTNSPSAKRLRSDDLEDCLEGEEVATDNKRIRSL